MNYTHRGQRVRSARRIDAEYRIPRGTLGTVTGETENLGRTLVFVDWENIGPTCVFPDDVEYIVASETLS